MSIKVKGWDFKDFLNEAIGNVNEELENEKEELVDELQAATPIDTGEARAGWVTTSEGIENPVEHIDDLNQGTSKQAGARFIETTLLQHEGVSPSGIIVRRK